MLAGALVLAVLFAGALPRLRLDFNPVDLENPRAESVRTLFDLMADPNTSPYTIEFLATPAQAAAAADRLQRLPEVARVLSLGSFVPADQAPKLATLEDAASLLGPTLTPQTVKPAPQPAEVLAAVTRCADDMAKLGARGDRPAARLAAALRQVLQGGPAAIPALAANLSAGIGQRLDDLRLVLQAGPVSLETLPRGLPAGLGRARRALARAGLPPRGHARQRRAPALRARRAGSRPDGRRARRSPSTSGPAWPPGRSRRPACWPC